MKHTTFLSLILCLVSCVQAQDPNDAPDYSRVPTTPLESIVASPKDWWMLGTDADPTTSTRVVGSSIGIPSEALDLLSGYNGEGFYRLLERIEGVTVVTTAAEMADARDDPTTVAIGVYGWITIDEDFTDANAIPENIPVVFFGDSGFQFGPTYNVEMNGPVIARPHVKIFKDAINRVGNKPSVFGTFSGVHRYLGWWCLPYPHELNHNVPLQAAIDSFLFTTNNVINNTIPADWKFANSTNTVTQYSGMLNIFHGGIFLTKTIILQNRILWFKGSGMGSLFRFEDFEEVGAISWDFALDTVTLASGSLADGDRVQLKAPWDAFFATNEASAVARNLRLQKTYEVINYAAGTFQLADVGRTAPVDILDSMTVGPNLTIEKCESTGYDIAFDIQTVTPGLQFEDCTVNIGQSCVPTMKVFNASPGGFMEPTNIEGNSINIEYGGNMYFSSGGGGMNHMSFRRNNCQIVGIRSEPIITGTITSVNTDDSTVDISVDLAGVNIETWLPLIGAYATMTITSDENAGTTYNIRETESVGNTVKLMNATNGANLTLPADLAGDGYIIFFDQYCGVYGLAHRNRTHIYLDAYDTKLNIDHNTFIGGEFGVYASDTRLATVNMTNNHWETTHIVAGVYGNTAGSIVMQGDRFSDFRDDDKTIFKNMSTADITYDVHVTANRQSNGNPLTVVYDQQHNGQLSESNQKLGPEGTQATSAITHGQQAANIVSSKAGYSLHTSAIDVPFAEFTFLIAPSDGDTISIGRTGDQDTYTFKSPLSAGPTVPNEVLIDADLSIMADNLEAAVERNSGEGTVYGVDTPINRFFFMQTNADRCFFYWKLQEPTVPTDWEITGTFVVPGTISEVIYPVFDWATSPAVNVGHALGLDRFWRADASVNAGDGTLVSDWPDVMGSGKDWVPAVAPDNPSYDIDGLYGQPAVRFDGTDWFQLLNSNMFPNIEGAAFFVVKFDDNPVASEYVFHTGLDGGHSFLYSSSIDRMLFSAMFSGGNLSVQSPALQKEFKDFACLVAWDTSTVPVWSSDSRGTMWGANKYDASFIQNDTTGSPVVGEPSTLTFGLGATSIGAAPMTGHIADVGIWHTRPNRATIRKALGYINARYDLSIPFELDP